MTAARGAFSRAGFDHAGLREIAAAAATDAAVIIRLFGSKEALFVAVAAGAFGLEGVIEGPRPGLGERIARHLLSPTQATEDADGFDEFQFLLRSATSPTAAPILAASLQAGFVAPLAKQIGGREAEARAGLITAYVLGFATLRVALGSPALAEASPGLVVRRLGGAIQACLDEVA